ncbi:MAG: hypothetical protein ACR2KK_00475 [Acidimicrobiales bacterium]
MSTPAVTAVWMCPECGHGSSEPRDERAHLDAHRQLRAFFQEWEAGTVAVQEDRGRPRRRTAVVTMLVVLVLLASATVFSRINRTPDAFRATAPAPTVPADERARSQPDPVAPAPTARGTDPSPGRPAPSARPVAPVPLSPPPVQIRESPPVTTAPPAPAPAPAITTPVPVQTPPPPAHLLSVCILGICLHVL